jgi:predicted transcriptional regulator
MAHNAQSARTRTQVLAREAFVIQKIAEGRTFLSIAEEMGVSHARVRQIYARGQKRYPCADLEEIRAAQHERILTATRELFELARDPKASFTARALAYNTIKGLADREARLMGLDAPTRTEVKVLTKDSVGAEIERLSGVIALRAAQAGLPIPELPKRRLQIEGGSND